MNIEYEWLLINDLDDEDPEKEEVEKIIKDRVWLEFDRKKRPFYLESSVAEELFIRNHSDWECYEEDEYVFLAIREQGSERTQFSV
ncbi:TPA: hypothetical protein ACPPF3_000848 [Haemophilus influenzae]|uniref:hypothetical protein n=1 Tax=Haemophilus influenzae TaxID=727 RepID=UPI000CFFE80C|nr:hypothetical protein [Haemophilus influenzae]PRI59588.1 hypothetical protein BVZ80_01884 [Haemophilus influenzae]PRI61393.1 hypothetical protein BVZ79_00569 [Haemophilus influenzae]PRM23078.1 hypothetical protein BVZ96_00228 [Haemophilus influenzae]